MLLEHLGNIIPVLLEMIRHNIVDIPADTHFDALQCQQVYQFRDSLMRSLTDINRLSRTTRLDIQEGAFIGVAPSTRFTLCRHVVVIRFIRLFLRSEDVVS